MSGLVNGAGGMGGRVESRGLGEERTWADESVLIRIPEGPAILGTDDETTLAAVEIDTPWYAIRRIEAPSFVELVPAYWMGSFPITGAQYSTFLNEIDASPVDGLAIRDGVPLAMDVHAWLSGRDPREHEHGVGVQFVRGQGWQPVPGSDALPVTLVTWFGASAYASHFSARLPREVEWEKGARGEHGYRFPWGNDYVAGNANLADYWLGRPVGTQAAWDSEFSIGGAGAAWLASRPNRSGAFPQGLSPYGLEDMIGNVAEWCDDVYDASDEGGRADFRAMRGAGRYGYPAIARCATRRRRAPESAGENLGFRIAVDSWPDRATG